MAVFRKTHHFTEAKCKFPKDGWIDDGSWGLAGVAREARTVNAGFGRSRINAGSMKMMENGRNMNHMALLGLKLGQNECQRRREFDGNPPASPKPNKRFKMADFGSVGERQKNRIKNHISNSRSSAFAARMLY